MESDKSKEIMRVHDLLVAGKTRQETAEETGVPYEKVCRWARQFKIPTPATHKRPQLNSRDARMLQLWADGMPIAEIAAVMKLGERTVMDRVTRLRKKSVTLMAAERQRRQWTNGLVGMAVGKSPNWMSRLEMGVPMQVPPKVRVKLEELYGMSLERLLQAIPETPDS